MDTEKEALFVPAFASGGLTPFIRFSDETIEERYLSSYTDKQSLRVFNQEDNPYFSLKDFQNNPALLISAGSNYTTKDFRNQLMVGDECKVFIDSGGFQIKMGKVDPTKYTNEIAFKWSEENGDIFPILDWPTGSTCYDSNTALTNSLASAKYYSENRKHKGEQVLNVLQGESKSEVEKWFKELSKYQFDGWGVGGITDKNPNAKVEPEVKFCLALLTLYSSGEFEKEHCKRLHLFGVSSFPYMIYFQYIQRILNKQCIDVQISYDTTSWNQQTFRGKYSLGRSTKFTGASCTFTSQKEYTVNKDFRFPCPYDCPICVGLGDVNSLLMEFKNGERQFQNFSFLVSFHNLYVTLKVEKEIRNILSADCPSVYDACFPKKITDNLRHLQTIFDKEKRIDKTDAQRRLLVTLFSEENVLFPV